MNERPTAIVAEDEPALREWLLRRLQEAWPELTIVGEAADGLVAEQMIEQLRPDAAFLDIRMPGQSGLEVAAAARGICHVVFITAFEEFAVAAFEAEAVDYLLKPIDEERLARTVQRLKARMSSPPPDLSAILAQFAPQRQEHLSWVQASCGNTIEFVEVERVDAFIAEDKVTICKTTGKEYILRTPLKELESQLDPSRFWRIHRNAIVRIAAIEKAERDSFGVAVRLRGHGKPYSVSRAYSGRFHGM